MKLTAFVDGGGKWNDRHANIGLLILDAETKEVLVEEGHDIGDASNNEAEYTAVVMALYHANRLGAKAIQVYSDSKLVVNQLSGEWRVHENHLRCYYDEIMDEAQNLDFNISWIPRRENKQADALSRGAVEKTSP